MLGIKHIKFDSMTYVFHFKNGRVNREGRGLSFYYFVPNSSIVAIPMGSNDLPFIFRESTNDYQSVSIQGQISYKICNPQMLSDVLDFTVPAWRLPKEIGDFSALYRYMEELKIGRSSVIRYFRLGEKYFPSVGITPEQVYPYVIWLNEPDDSLAWVDLDELYTHAGQLEDEHLLICLYRLKHALADYNSK